MLHPARFREYLRELLLGYRLGLSVPVKKYGPGAAGALVQSQDVFLHQSILLQRRVADVTDTTSTSQ